MALIHFLLVYNFELQRLVFSQQFEDPEQAVAEYARLEAEHRNDANLEIVLVGADSLDTIKTTHGHYFDGDARANASPFLAGV
jgi:hypothetical protein